MSARLTLSWLLKMLSITCSPDNGEDWRILQAMLGWGGFSKYHHKTTTLKATLTFLHLSYDKDDIWVSDCKLTFILLFSPTITIFLPPWEVAFWSRTFCHATVRQLVMASAMQDVRPYESVKLPLERSTWLCRSESPRYFWGQIIRTNVTKCLIKFSNFLTLLRLAKGKDCMLGQVYDVKYFHFLKEKNGYQPSSPRD